MGRRLSYNGDVHHNIIVDDVLVKSSSWCDDDVVVTINVVVDSHPKVVIVVDDDIGRGTSTRRRCSRKSHRCRSKRGRHVLDVIVDLTATLGLSSRRLRPKVIIVVDVMIHDVVVATTTNVDAISTSATA